MARRKADGLSVDSLKHKDKRVNIPTKELRDFVDDQEAKPKTLLYPRDPSLDPQLVWKGKDEQDREPLAVEALPIYIQEKIHPQAIIEDIRAHARQEEAQVQFSFFNDFNGLEFDKLVEFYQHEQKWTNRMILGDSLLVMASLAEKEGLKGKVQMIYFDPPYGIKFGSNWQVSTRKRDVKDGDPESVTRQPEQVRAFRDTWKIGIHSYLAYLRDRLVVARELIAESGSIFVQIGDENIHLVRCLLDEVFGSENFISLITFRGKSALGTALLPSQVDYLLWYAKNKGSVKYRQLYEIRSVSEDTHMNYVELADGSTRTLTEEEKTGTTSLPYDARVFRLQTLVSSGYTASCTYSFKFAGRSYIPSHNKSWKTTPEGMQRLAQAGRVCSTGDSIQYIQYHNDFPVKELTNIWLDTHAEQDKAYVVQTHPKVIERCLLMTTDPGDLVVDPTCGSGTTAYVAEQWGRRWITIDTSRVALALARTRLMTARFPFYLLADSPEGIAKECEVAGRVPPVPMPKTENDIRKGFVYKRVPHITLKSIANNTEIDEIHARYKEIMEPIRAQLNSCLRTSMETWEIPREAKKEWPEEARSLLTKWWHLNRERQREIDASISRHADQEYLYDQPYEDSKRIRVTGPFTVESLSPHRVLSTEDERPASELVATKDADARQYEEIVLEHLKRAGIQNTRRNERLKFDRLDPYPGTWIQASGEYTDAEGKTRRVAIALGPEHGTVGPDMIKEAAKEAVQGIGFDILAVCGFAFDPHVSEEAKRYGKLTVLIVRMNPDLLMGDLLKSTGSGNLFMVFGEPDLECRWTKDGKLVVELKGVDIYDPTTGAIRSSSTDDIACWFIDTDYNGESFFVRRAHFLGGDDAYDKLKRTLRAEISEEAWAALYSTRSLPFDPPKSGRIAVKVINHYGDEALKVYDVGRPH